MAPLAPDRRILAQNVTMQKEMSAINQRPKRRGKKDERKGKSEERSTIESIVDLIYPNKGEWLIPENFLEEVHQCETNKKICDESEKRNCPYFDPEGTRRGYEIDDVELLMSRKYEEASYKEKRLEGLEMLTQADEKEKN